MADRVPRGGEYSPAQALISGWGPDMPDETPALLSHVLVQAGPGRHLGKKLGDA